MDGYLHGKSIKESADVNTINLGAVVPFMGGVRGQWGKKLEASLSDLGGGWMGVYCVKILGASTFLSFVIFNNKKVKSEKK